jgi:hypothetical protein
VNIVNATMSVNIGCKRMRVQKVDDSTRPTARVAMLEACDTFTLDKRVSATKSDVEITSGGGAGHTTREASRTQWSRDSRCSQVVVGLRTSTSQPSVSTRERCRMTLMLLSRFPTACFSCNSPEKICNFRRASCQDTCRKEKRANFTIM